MSGQTFTRRAAIVACGALALAMATRGGAALAQSGVAIGAIRVDVAPLRANSGDPTATWVQEELPRQLAQALAGRLTPKGAHAHRADRLSHPRAEQGQPGLGRHQRRRDGWGASPGRCGRRRDIGLRRSMRRRSCNPITTVFRRPRRRWRSGSPEIYDPAGRFPPPNSLIFEGPIEPPSTCACFTRTAGLSHSAACAGSHGRSSRSCALCAALRLGSSSTRRASATAGRDRGR